MKRSRRRLKLRRMLPTFLVLFGAISFISVVLKQDGFIRYFELQKTLSRIHQETQDLRNNHIALLSEIERLKNKPYIEQIAREDLGMLKSNEIFVIVDDASTKAH